MSVELSDRPETNITEVNSVKYDTSSPHTHMTTHCLHGRRKSTVVIGERVSDNLWRLRAHQPCMSGPLCLDCI